VRRRRLTRMHPRCARPIRDRADGTPSVCSLSPSHNYHHRLSSLFLSRSRSWSLLPVVAVVAVSLLSALSLSHCHTRSLRVAVPTAPLHLGALCLSGSTHGSAAPSARERFATLPPPALSARRRPHAPHPHALRSSTHGGPHPSRPCPARQPLPSIPPCAGGRSPSRRPLCHLPWVWVFWGGGGGRRASAACPPSVGGSGLGVCASTAARTGHAARPARPRRPRRRRRRAACSP
jgi:hypothetical protein